MGTTTTPNAGSGPARTSSGGQRQGSNPKKPEQRTDHFRRAVIAVVVFVVLIGGLVLLKGIISPVPQRQREEAARSPVPDASPGAGLSSYDQSLAAYKAAHPHEDQARSTGQGGAASDDGGSKEDQADMSFLKQAWRKPLQIGDNKQPLSGPPRDQRTVQPPPLPSPAPGMASQQPVATPAELAERFRLAEERLARLRAMQAQQRQQAGGLLLPGAVQ